MYDVLEKPELVALILFLALSRPIRNGEFRWLLHTKRVSKYFLDVIQEHVYPHIDTLPGGILKRINPVNLADFKCLSHFNTFEVPSIDVTTLSTLVRLPSLFIGAQSKLKSLSFLQQMTRLRKLTCNMKEIALEREDIPFLTNLTELGFAFSNVTNEDISPLTNLSTLVSIHNPNITGDLLLTLTKITDLRLNHTENDFYKLPESCITSLTALTIRTDNNFSPEIKMNHFCNLRKLYLYAISNFNGLGELSHMEHLVISQPEGTEGLHEALPKLTNLTNLWIGNNETQIDISDIVTKLKKLTNLTLYGPILDDDALQKMTMLEYLDIIRNDVTVTNQSITHLTNLTSLRIQSRGIFSSENISRLSSLKEFTTNSTYFVTEDFLQLTNITKLSLLRPNPNIHLPDLMQLTRLEYIDILGGLEDETEMKKKFWEKSIDLKVKTW